MDEWDIARPDRDVGAMLSGADVERLRDIVGWLRRERGMRLTDIAIGSDTAEHTVRNFAYRKSIRPDNTFLGKLYKFVAARETQLPDGVLSGGGEERPRGRVQGRGRIGRFDLIRMELAITEDDLNRVFDRYSGYYLCFRRSFRPDRILVSWLHIMPLNPKLDIANEGLPLPRFTLFTEYPDPVDPEHTRSFIVGGYVTRRNGHIYFTGQNDGELKYVILKEPANRRFSYLQGLSLLTSADDGALFAARVVCQHLGRTAAREDWADRIGVFATADFDARFENAGIIRRAIGTDGVLAGNTPAASPRPDPRRT